MAKEPAKAAGARATDATARPEIHIVGLTKTGPNRYAVVTGTTTEPLIDTVSQPLEYALQACGVAMLRLSRVVP